MNRTIEIAALGELLIDFTFAGVSASGQKLFEQNPGGGPPNFLTMCSRMGFRTAFIGKVGADMHGKFLKERLRQENISVEQVIEDPDCFTTLAFVDIGDSGERTFSFARKPGADTLLTADELDRDLLRSCRLFHFSSLSLTDEPVRSATFEAVKTAREGGAVISFDPNYRSTLWKSEEAAVDMIRHALPYADLLKVSDEESALITGEADPEKALLCLLKAGPAIVSVTLGKDGVLAGTKAFNVPVPAFPADAVDTTGAGDSFWGGFVSRFLRLHRAPSEISREDLESCCRTGNAAASLCVRKRGGIPAMPSEREIEELLN